MTQQPPARVTWWQSSYLILVLALVIGAGLRVSRSGFECLNFDEMWQLKVASGRPSTEKIVPRDVLVAAAPDETALQGAPPWYSIWTTTSSITHPPVPFILLRFWRELFGESDQTARAMSIVCSLCTVVLIFIAGRMVNGSRPALWAAILFAVAPVQVYEGQQVRGYAPLQMFAVAAAVCLILLEQRRSIRAAVGLGLFTLLMMLTHYFAVGVALAMGLYTVIRLRGRARWMAITAFAIAALLFSVLWLPRALDQRDAVTGAGVFLTEESSHPNASAIARAASAPWRQVISDGVIVLRRNSRMPWPYLPAVLFVIPLWFLRRRPDLLLWYLWLVCYIGLLLVLDIARGTSELRFTRYIALTAPGVFLLFTALLKGAPKWLACGLPAIVMAGALMMSRSTYFNEEGNWDQIGAILDANGSKEEAVVIYPGTQPRWYSSGYYYAAAHFSHTFPRPALRLSSPASDALLRQIPGTTAWFITSATSPRPEEFLRGVSVLEQYDVGSLATCWRVQLPAH